MTEYYCRALGENDWGLVKADSPNDAASHYVSRSVVLRERAYEDSVSVFVRLSKNGDLENDKIQKFNVSSETIYITKLL
jgi:hypothetical protein